MVYSPERNFVVEPDENSEDKEKCPTLSPSDDDEDLSDEDGSGTGELYMYYWIDIPLIMKLDL